MWKLNWNWKEKKIIVKAKNGDITPPIYLIAKFWYWTNILETVILSNILPQQEAPPFSFLQAFFVIKNRAICFHRSLQKFFPYLRHCGTAYLILLPLGLIHFTELHFWFSAMSVIYIAWVDVFVLAEVSLFTMFFPVLQLDVLAKYS